MRINKFGFLAALISSVAVSGEIEYPLGNVSVSNTESDYLSIQNMSGKDVDVDIYGEIFHMKPASGVVFNCGSYSHLELKFINISHDYFEVHCRSKVVIN